MTTVTKEAERIEIAEAYVNGKYPPAWDFGRLSVVTAFADGYQEGARSVQTLLNDVSAALISGMVIAHKTPGANDTLVVLQTTYAQLRAYWEKVK